MRQFFTNFSRWLDGLVFPPSKSYIDYYKGRVGDAEAEIVSLRSRFNDMCDDTLAASRALYESRRLVVRYMEGQRHAEAEAVRMMGERDALDRDLQVSQAIVRARLRNEQQLREERNKALAELKELKATPPFEECENLKIQLDKCKQEVANLRHSQDRSKDYGTAGDLGCN